MNNKDKKVIKEYYNLRYPPGTHELDLDVLFDYYAGLIDKALHNKIDLGHSLNKIEESDIKKIKDYIKRNKSNNNGKEMETYYEKFQETINILNKYYDRSGKYKVSMNKINKKRIVFIIMFFAIFIIWLLLSYNRTYKKLDEAMKADNIYDKTLKVYKYDEEAFVIHTGEHRFNYYVKNDGKWKLDFFHYSYYLLTDNHSGPGMAYHISDRTKRAWVSFDKGENNNIEDYNESDVVDSLGSDFYITIFENKYVRWNTIIEIPEDGEYIVYIDGTEYKVDFNSFMKNNIKK